MSETGQRPSAFTSKDNPPPSKPAVFSSQRTKGGVAGRTTTRIGRATGRAVSFQVIHADRPLLPATVIASNRGGLRGSGTEILPSGLPLEDKGGA